MFGMTSRFSFTELRHEVRWRAWVVRVLIAMATCAAVAVESGPRDDGAAKAESLAIEVEGNSSIILASLSADDGSATVGARPFEGGPVEFIAREVPALRVATADLGAELSLAPDIVSVDADGDGALAVIGRTLWPEAGDALTTHGAAEASTDLIMPLAELFHRGMTTYVAIQNTDSASAATVQVNAVKTQESRISASGEISIPAGGSAGFWLGSATLPDLPEGWRGTLSIRSDRPVAAVAWVSDEDGGPAVFDVPAVPSDSAAPEWYIPTVRSQRPTGGGSSTVASTRIAIANPSDRIAVLVTADLVGRSGICAGSTITSATKTIRSGSMIVMDFGADPDRSDYDFEAPADCEGSVRVYTSLGDVVVTEVEETWNRSGRRTGASGAPAKSTNALGSRLIAPWRLTGSDAPVFGRELAAVNASEAPAAITVKLHADDGSVETCLACTATLGPLGSMVWAADDLLLSNGEAPESVELDADQPIAAVVDDAAGGSGDRARFEVPMVSPGGEPIALEHHPLLLANAALPVAPRAPTPTPFPTATAFPTGPRPSSVPPGPVTPPTPIPSRTPSPTPTLVPTEIPLGDVVLQNLDAAARALSLEVIAADGSTAARVDLPNVAPSAAGVVDIADLADRLGTEPHGGMADGATNLGALVINSAARGAVAAYAAPSVAETVIIPAAFVDFGGRTTALGVENASSDRTVNVDVELVPYGRESFTRRTTITLPPGANRTYRLGVSTDFVAIPAPPSGFSGWMRLVADGPIAAVADVTRSDRPIGAWTVQGVPSGEASDNYLVPAVYGGDEGLRTSLHLFNPSAGAIEARIDYRGASSGCTDLSIAAPPVTVPSFSGVEVLPPDDASFAEADCSAVAEVEADGPLFVDVAIHRGDEEASAGFPALADSQAVRRAALPRVAIDVDGTSSRIWIANTDASSVEAQVRLFAADGAELPCGADCSLDVAGRGGAVVDLGAIASLSSGFASAEISAKAPIQAVAFDVPSDMTLDLSAYEAIDASGAGAPKALPLLIWTIRPGFVVGPTPTATSWPTSTKGPTPTPFSRPTVGPRPTIGPGPGPGPGPGFSGPFDIIGAQNFSRSERAVVGAELFAERTGAGDAVALVPADPWALTAIDGRLGPIAPDRRAAWLTSDQSIAAWAMHGLESGGVFGHLGSLSGFEVVVPVMMAGFGDQWSTLHVQGAEPSGGPHIVNIDILKMGSATPLLTLEASFERGAFISVAMRDVVEDLGVDAGDPSGQVFAAHIKSEGPVSALAVVEHPDGWAYDVAGTPIDLAAELLIVPMIRSNFESSNSGVFLYNPESESATARLTYRGFAGTCAGEDYPTSAPIVVAGFDYRALYYLPGPDHPLPSGCEASLVVEGDRPLIAVVNNATGVNDGVLAYPAAGPLEAANLVGIPRVHVDDFGRTTTLYVTHAGEDSEDLWVSVELIDGTGFRSTCERCTRILGPGMTAKIDLSAEKEYASGFVGSAMIESGGPVVALAVDEPNLAPISSIGAAYMSVDTAAWRGAPAEGPLAGRPRQPQPLPIAVWAWLSGSPEPTPTPFTRPTPPFGPAVGVIYLPRIDKGATEIVPSSAEHSIEGATLPGPIWR